MNVISYHIRILVGYVIFAYPKKINRPDVHCKFYLEWKIEKKTKARYLKVLQENTGPRV